MNSNPSLRGNVAELRALVRLAGPLALAQAGQAAMGLVDTAMTGRLSSVAQGAVGLGNGLYFTVSALGIGVMLGLDPLISQAVGAGQLGRARQLLWQGGYLAVALTLVLGPPLVGLCWGMRHFGLDDEISAHTTAYVLGRLLGLAPFFVFSSARSFLQGVGRPLGVLAAALGANMLNFALDVVLIFGAGPIPAMGVAGAGLATALVTLFQAAFLVWLAVRHGGARQRSFPKLDLVEVRHAVRVGLPIGAQMAAEVGVFALVGFAAGLLGAKELAAHQIVLTYASFSFCFALGVGNATSVRVGWAVGRKDTGGARAAGVLALASGIAFMALSGLVYLVVPEALARLMTRNPSDLAAAIPLFGVAAVFQVADGAQAVVAGALRGAGDTPVTFWANLWGHYAVGVPLALVLAFGLGLGLTGLWWGLCAGLFVVAAALVARFLALTRRPIVPLSERTPVAGQGT